jgi:hypothetical protein
MTLGGLLDLGWRILGIPIIIGFMNGLAITRVTTMRREDFQLTLISSVLSAMFVHNGKFLGTPPS